MALEEGFEGGAFGQGLDDPPVFSRTDEVPRGPLAQHEPQCVYQYGLARAGLAREQGQAGAKLDLEGGDESNVVDSK